ncbi:tyrosine-type recombinase/integrase [Ketobacter alkanivorans]|uniref:Integrase n=1 Tax=Ketobacter alkanivorans TaxID=1917421 RepID=A0A2K9LHX9_9GAMM|nr:integrase arm-type DNA-binding domain-containing protein [Ketobacter alkanivorans]AUM11976.1 integrase [Ketobacter alkanivorans]
MPLTALAVKQAKPKESDYKLTDGGGMYLLVSKKGGKYWRLKYRFAGKEKVLALGVYPSVSLEQARQERDKAKKLLPNTDPNSVKRVDKASNLEAAENNFELVATEWYSNHMVNKSDSHRTRTWRLLKNDLFPPLGKRPISDITPPELLKVLRRVESRGAIDTAHRAHQTAGQVFRYAVATGRAERDPSADLRGALKIHIKKHHAAITEPKELGKLLLAMDSFGGTPVVKAALQLSPLLFVRPKELRHMEWTEIDWDQALWQIPADKMKMKEPHIVPLSVQAIAILEEIHSLTGRGKYVFPSARGGSRPLSENGVRVALRTMGYDNDTMTAHGFRATARTILDEVLCFRVDLIEHQLAHTVRDTNGRAYNRTKHLPQRKDMMQKWADYLNGLKLKAQNGNIIAGRFK